MISPFSVSRFRNDDQTDWQAMWAEYFAIKPKPALNSEVVAANWQAIVSNDGRLSALALRHAATGRAIGFAQYIFHYCSRSGGQECYLNDLFVTSDQRGKGGATTLLETLIAECRDQGMYRVTWIAKPDNTAAQRVYGKLAERTEWIRYVALTSE